MYPPPPPNHHHHHPTTVPSGIHGGLLEVTVVGCTKLKDTEWISRQDPYVCVEYGSSKFRTRTCTDGHKNPTFQEKFNLTLIEGLREIHLQVWNSNTLSSDTFIGSAKIQLQKVLSQGFDDNSWTLHSKSGRYAGEVRLIMHYANAQKPATTAYNAAVSPPLNYYSAAAPAPPPQPQPQYHPPYNSYPPPPPPSATYNYNPPNYPYNYPTPPVAQPHYNSSSAAAAATAYPPPPPPSASPYPPPVYPPPIYPPRPY